jgi:protein-tyrosine phosphatase
MAEMIFKDLIIKNNKRYMFSCVSRATSMEELGNPIYPQAKRKLEQRGVTCESHRATQITKEDYDKYDYIMVMEERNRRDLLRIIGEDKDNKIHLLMEYTKNNKDIDDPWYSGDFDTAFNEINEGCISLYNYLMNLGDKDEV